MNLRRFCLPSMYHAWYVLAMRIVAMLELSEPANYCQNASFLSVHGDHLAPDFSIILSQIKKFLYEVGQELFTHHLRSKNLKEGDGFNCENNNWSHRHLWNPTRIFEIALVPLTLTHNQSTHKCCSLAGFAGFWVFTASNQPDKTWKPRLTTSCPFLLK